MLQSWAALLLQSGAGSITKWSRYYKVGQVLLPSGAGITKWGVITKWCITDVKVREWVEQIIHLSKIARTHTHSAYSAFIHVFNIDLHIS